MNVTFVEFFNLQFAILTDYFHYFNTKRQGLSVFHISVS